MRGSYCIFTVIPFSSLTDQGARVTPPYIYIIYIYSLFLVLVCGQITIDFNPSPLPPSSEFSQSLPFPMTPTETKGVCCDEPHHGALPEMPRHGGGPDPPAITGGLDINAITGDDERKRMNTPPGIRLLNLNQVCELEPKLCRVGE